MHNACLAGVAEMMGRQAGGQERLFYSFNLESVVPENHLLRGINRCLDLRDPESMVGLTFERLYVEPLVFAVRPGHPLLAEPNPFLAAVLDYPLIVSTKGTVPRHNTENLFHASGLRLPDNCVETLAVTVSALLCLRSDAVRMSRSKRSGSVGNSGVRFSNRILFLAFSGD